MNEPTIYTHVHTLSRRPTVEVTEQTYPSLVITEGLETDLTVSITGDAADRLAFAEALRQAATTIEEWTEERGRAPSEAAETEVVPA